MKKFFTLFLTLMTSVMLWAYDFQSGDLYYNITSNVAPYTVEVTSGNIDYSGDITIPSSVTYDDITYAVTSIGMHAFGHCSSLTSVTIPNSVTSISDSTFYNCSSLTSVTIPNSVTSIGYNAFWGCSSLTSVTIPNSVTSIGGSAFYNCTSLTSVTFEGRTPPSIDRDVFYNTNNCPIYVPCGTKEAYVTALNENNTIDESRVIEQTFSASGYCGADSTNLTWELSCDSILTISGTGEMVDWNYGEQNYAPWSDYSNFVVTVILPDGLTHIGHSAFFGCSKLQNINIPNTVTSVGEYALTKSSNPLLPIINGIRYADTYLVGPINNNLSSYVIEEGTKWIGTHAFYTVAISSITIPNSVIGISSGSFIYTGLTEITIPNSVETIGYSAFYDCNHLKDVIIGSGVKWIGHSAFSDCNSLSSITCKAVIPPVLEEARVFRYTSKTIPLYVPAESIDAYKAAEEWKEFINILPIEEDPAPCLIASGTCGAQGDNLTWELSCDSVLTISGTGAMADYSSNTDVPWHEYRSSILSVIITDGVTSIGYDAFQGCSSLTSVTIPNSVTSIETHAFYNCSSLTSVTIPSSVTSIGTWAFYNCSSLTSVTIPSSVTSIGGHAFYNCSSLTSVTIPNSVTSIGIYAFNTCSSLTSVTIPESVTNIGDRAFYNCSSLTSVTIPNSVTSIGSGAFAGCSSLTSITIPSSVTSIGSSAFSRCSSLTSITIPNSVTSIGSSAFYNCTSLTSVTIPESVTSIGEEAFYHCSSLTSVTIPNSVTSIGGNAFAGCSSLTSVTIPSSVTSIGYAAFSSCSSLTSVTIPNSVTSIGGPAFYGCSSLTSVTIPNSVTSIGGSAFYGCSSLTSVTIPSSVTSIGGSAFYGCSSLTSVTFEGSTPPTINRNVFHNTNNCPIYIPCGTKDAYVAALNVNNTIDESRVIEKTFIASGYCGADSTNLTWELSCDSILTISGTGEMVDYTYNTMPWYEYGRAIKSVIITNGVTSIGGSAFAYCSSLTSVTIGNGVTSIGEYAFHCCSSLTSVAIPNSVTSIGHAAFNGCSSLTSVTIGDSVTYIGANAFSGCSSLTSVTIPNSVTSIGYNAFMYCRSLTSITIPNSVTSIGYAAFDGCSSLNTIYVEATNPPALGANAFTNTSVSTCHIPCGTKAAYEASDWASQVSEFVEDCDNGFYSRTVRIGYNTICLPHGSSNFTGATFYEIAHILKNKKKIFFDEVKTLEAGKPYIFYPHSNEVTIYYDNTTSAIPLSHNGLHGTFDGITAASNFLKGKYLVAGNRMVLCGDGCSLATNRAYIELDEISDKDHPAIPGIKRVSMDYSEENATTALDNITDESIVAPIQEGVYDILGRKVDAPTVSGFYIINGKKVFVAL